MPCNGCDGSGANCLRTSCTNKQEVVPLMQRRLSGCIGSIPADGVGLNTNFTDGIHFGQAILFVSTFFKICEKSAKAILVHWHNGGHLVVAPCIKTPQYVMFHSTSKA